MSYLTQKEILDNFSQRPQWDTSQFGSWVNTLGYYSSEVIELAKAQIQKDYPGKDKFTLDEIETRIFQVVEQQQKDGTLSKQDNIAFERDRYRLLASLIKDDATKTEKYQQYCNEYERYSNLAILLRSKEE